jgi:mannose-6-phosphate isomerase-like protein (cupin superfamily)
MFIEKYPSFRIAVEVATRLEKRYLFERRELEKGEMIKWHFHRKTDEIIIVDEGAFLLAIEEERIPFFLEKGGEAMVIYLSKGRKHALLPISEISFWVYKTQEDGMVPCKGPILKEKLRKTYMEIERLANKTLPKED